MNATMAERLREIVSYYCITQEEFAKSVGVDKSNVNKWLRGKSQPRLSSRRNIVAIYKCDSKWLKSGEGLMFGDADVPLIVSNDLSKIGKRILNWLEGKPFSYISKKLSVDENIVLNALAKDAHPETHFLKQIAECLGRTLDELTHGNNLYEFTTTSDTIEKSYSSECRKLDDGILLEMQDWINEMERIRPGRKIWFRIEFENRFPEFADWQQKKRAGNDH